MNKSGGQGPNGVIGYGAGAPQGGVTLLATASQLSLLPPEVWDGFKRAVKSAAGQWGIQVAIQDHPTIQEAHIRFWQAQRAMQQAAIDEAAKRSE